MSTYDPLPLVGISCNFRETDGHQHHTAGDRYTRSVAEFSNVAPVLLPALGDAAAVDALLEHLHGIALTGGVSNVEPHHYDGPPSREETPHDPLRDGVILPLIRGAAARGLPVLGICRGFQEVNVAFGGSLHQYLWEVPGRFDHRRPRHKPMEEQLAPRHKIRITPGSLLAELAGAEEIKVNSLHGQGVDRLGDGLAVEAVAMDGTVEAIRAVDVPGFCVAVQWHAEWAPDQYPLHAALFRAFGDAVRDYARKRRMGLNVAPMARSA